MCMKKNTSPLPSLTIKEKAVLQFIEDELLKKEVSPSYQEICDHFGFASYNSVQNYLKQLSNKGYVHIPQNQKRAIQVLNSVHDFKKDLIERLQNTAESSKGFSPGQSSTDHENHSKVLPIPFLGRVAAGTPIERLHENEFINIPAYLVKSHDNHFALKVEGDSMIDEGIFDGDTIVVRSQKVAKDGDLVVASVDNEATVKKYFYKINPEQPELGKQIELRPANPRLRSIWYNPKEVEIKGLVSALFRTYN